MSEEFTREAKIFIYGKDDIDDASYERLYKNIDDEDFQNTIILLKITPFVDYVKRYMYKKYQMEGAFDDISDKKFRAVFRQELRKNGIPEKRIDTFRHLFDKRVDVVERGTVFAIGFGLAMSLEDVSMLLKKAAKQHDFDFKDCEEIIYYYCFSHGYNYAGACDILSRWEELENKIYEDPGFKEEMTVSYRKKYSSVTDEDSLFEFLTDIAKIAKIKKAKDRMKRSRTRVLINLVAKIRKQIIQTTLYSMKEDEEVKRRVANIGMEDVEDLLDIDNLSDADLEELVNNGELMLQLYDLYEEDFDNYDAAGQISKGISSLIDEARDQSPRVVYLYDVKAVGTHPLSLDFDVLSSIKDNWVVGIANEWANWIDSARVRNLDRIMNGRIKACRNDIITLAFLTWVFENRPDPDGGFQLSPDKMFEYGVEAINEALEKADMMPFYLPNPFESFIAICLYSRNPELTFKVVYKIVELCDEYAIKAGRKKDIDKNYMEVFNLFWRSSNIRLVMPHFESEVKLGRDQSKNDYSIKNKSVSDEHAVFYYTQKGLFVKDLDSENHTYVNGKQIPEGKKIQIKDGDKVTLGSEDLYVESKFEYYHKNSSA